MVEQQVSLAGHDDLIAVIPVVPALEHLDFQWQIAAQAFAVVADTLLKIAFFGFAEKGKEEFHWQSGGSLARSPAGLIRAERLLR